MWSLQEQRRKFEQAGRGRRRRMAVGSSLVLHGLLLIGAVHWYPKPVEKPDKLLEISLVSQGETPGKAAPPQEAQPAPAPPATLPKPRPPSPPAPAPKAPPVAPQGTLPPVADAQPDRLPEPMPARPSPSPAPAPRSFADWQRSRMSAYLPRTLASTGGLPSARDRISNKGRDKCQPFPGRTPKRLYLLFDSSGSMSPDLNAQAHGCAQEYARTAIAGGATVVVGNFAGTATFSQPTTDMLEIASALHTFNDPTRTVLPTDQMNPFFEQDPSAPSELVILSDGYIPNYRDAIPWLQYFLDMNPENRGYLYTLGAPGHPEVTSALKGIGFDVYVYRVL